MNNMEDRLWDYIDGTCLPDELMAIDALLKTDPLVKARYDELSGLHRQLQSMELDEPSMGFKNRVMEQVLVSPHPSTLKTKVDSRIISIIAGFFVLTIGGILAYMLSEINWQSNYDLGLPEVTMPTVNWSLLASPSFILFFLSLNVILGLALLDKMLSARRKHVD